MTALCAYPLIFPGLKGRGAINVFITITMFFNAGTIPNYLLMNDLKLLENPLVLIIPSCLSIYNMIIMRSFFYGIPDSLRESAEIDGASFIQILLKIYIPLSKPVFASLALFYAVGRWNGYGDALMYIKVNKQYFPLQLLLYNILNNTNAVEVAAQEGFMQPGLKDSLKSATVMFATVPILLIYPWLQRYFIAGVTMGAIKE
jgi:putative aldouronate transport system permease protein